MCDGIPNWSYLVFLAFTAFMGILYLVEVDGFCSLSFNKWQASGLWLWSFHLGYLVFVGIALDGQLVRLLLGGRVMQFLGAISCNLYIWHTLVIFFTKRIFLTALDVIGNVGSFLLFSLTSILLSIMVTFLSYHTLEVRLTRIIAEWKTKKETVLVQS